MIEEKTITIDDLALMVQKGFSEMKVYMDNRFDQIDLRFDRMELHQNNNEKRLDTTEQTVYFDHTPRITRLEEKTLDSKNS